jgi:hypothetical protein
MADETELVTVYVATDPNHGPIAKSLLRAKGIWFVQQGEHTSAAFGPFSSISGPAYFQVRPEDADRALEILNSFEVGR